MNTKKLCLLLVGAALANWTYLFAMEWYENYEKSLDAIKEKQWENALNYLNAAIAEKPEPKANAKTYGLRFIDYLPYLYRGIVQYALGNYEQAQQDLEKSERIGAVKKVSRDKDAYQKLQNYLAQVKKQTQIIAQKKRINSSLQQAISFFKQQKYKAAKEKFNAVLKLDPNHAEARNYLKRIEDEIAKLNMAKAESERQDTINIEFQAGVELFKQKKLNDAEQKFKTVLELDKNHPEANKYYNLIRTERQKLAKIDQEYRRGVKLFEGGNLNGAEEKFLAILRLDKNHTKAKYYLNRIKSTAGELKTQQKLERLLKDGITLFNNGDLKKAKEIFLNISQLEPDDSNAREYLDKINAVEKNIREGIEAFFEGDNDESIASLTNAAQQCSTNINIYTILGSAYAAKYLLLGETDKKLHAAAREYFNKALTLNSAYQLDKKYFSPRIIEIFNER